MCTWKRRRGGVIINYSLKVNNSVYAFLPICAPYCSVGFCRALRNCFFVYMYRYPSNLVSQPLNTNYQSLTTNYYIASMHQRKAAIKKFIKATWQAAPLYTTRWGMCIGLPNEIAQGIKLHVKHCWTIPAPKCEAVNILLICRYEFLTNWADKWKMCKVAANSHSS